MRVVKKDLYYSPAPLFFFSLSFHCCVDDTLFYNNTSNTVKLPLFN